MHAQLLEADNSYAKWGFQGDGGPQGEALFKALFANDYIEWDRIGCFQDVTMRLIATRLLPEEMLAAKDGAQRGVYVQGEVVNRKTALKKPASGKRFHVYCSPLNEGAAAVIDEVGKAFGFTVEQTNEMSELGQCAKFVVYLTALTWRSGETSAQFADEVRRAMDMAVPLLLVHEMPGVGGQEARHGCEFGTFFENQDGARGPDAAKAASPPRAVRAPLDTTPHSNRENGSGENGSGYTPVDLIDRGIYSTIAIGLKGGAWREASIVVLAEALSAGAVEEIAVSKSSLAQLKQIQMNAARIRRSLTRPSGKTVKRPSKLVTVCAATASASSEQPPEESVDCPSSSV